MGHQNSTMAARFILVSSALALCAVVALFALAADQYEDISTSELASKDAVVALKAMLAKQAAMDKQEQALFATLSSKQKAAVHKAAAAKKAKPLSKDDQIAKLKAQLAAAEAKEKKVEQHKTAKAKHLSGIAKIEHDESVMTTGKEFEKFHGTKAKRWAHTHTRRAHTRTAHTHARTHTHKHTAQDARDMPDRAYMRMCRPRGTRFLCYTVMMGLFPQVPLSAKELTENCAGFPSSINMSLWPK